MLRLKSSRKLRELVEALVRDHLRFIDVPHMRLSTLKRFLRQEHIELHLDLHRADCLGCHGLLDTYRFCVEKLEQFRREGAEEALRPKPLLSGRDLVAAGYTPGPLFREILAVVEGLQLEEKATTREQALGYVVERYPK